MRYTLSVLTAVCLLALGQPAWSDSNDRELLQRVRIAASALPDSDRASAAVVLQELQASARPAAAQRHLPFGRTVMATQHMLAQRHHSSVQAHQLPHTLVAGHWLKPEPTEVGERHQMQLDTAMVARWAAALQINEVAA